jgi:hypothetical protein
MKDQINCISDDIMELKINQAIIKTKLEAEWVSAINLLWQHVLRLAQ